MIFHCLLPKKLLTKLHSKLIINRIVPKCALCKCAINLFAFVTKFLWKFSFRLYLACGAQPVPHSLSATPSIVYIRLRDSRRTFLKRFFHFFSRTSASSSSSSGSSLAGMDVVPWLRTMWRVFGVSKLEWSYRSSFSGAASFLLSRTGSNFGRSPYPQTILSGCFVLLNTQSDELQETYRKICEREDVSGRQTRRNLSIQKKKGVIEPEKKAKKGGQQKNQEKPV